MDPRGLSGGDDCHRFGLGAEARDVLPDAAGKQFHILWQVSDVPAQRAGRPLLQGRAVQSDFAASKRPDADERSRQGRFSRAAGTNDSDACTSLE
jgi:hypothetical protein